MCILSFINTRVGIFAHGCYFGVRVINRPAGLVFCEVSLIFNLSHYLKFEIDLDHINLGKKKMRIADLSLATVVEIAEKFINNQLLVPEAEKEYEADNCEYFSIMSTYKMKKFKLVFCICSDRPRAIGIITLHRI